MEGGRRKQTPLCSKPNTYAGFRTEAAALNSTVYRVLATKLFRAKLFAAFCFRTLMRLSGSRLTSPPIIDSPTSTLGAAGGDAGFGASFT